MRKVLKFQTIKNKQDFIKEMDEIQVFAVNMQE